MCAQRDLPRPDFWQRGGAGSGGSNGPRGGGFRPGNGPMLINPSLNGDNLHVGRRRRTHSESQAVAEPERAGLRAEAAPFSPSSPSAGTWVNRSLYEQADGSFQTWQSSSPPTTSSPRERVPRALVFRSRRNPTGGAATTYSSSAAQHRGDQEESYHQGGRGGSYHRGRGRQYATRTHYRSSSEPKRARVSDGSGVGRGGRSRGSSETERTHQRNPGKTVTMSGLQCLMQDSVWFDKPRYDEAERRFYEGMNGITHSAQPPQEREASAILQDIAKARQNIQKSLAGSHSKSKRTSSSSTGAGDQTDLVSRMKSLELENQSLHKAVNDLRSMMSKMEARLTVLEKAKPAAASPASAHAAKTVVVQAPKKVEVKDEEEDDDDDLDLFGDDDDDEEAERLKAERVKAYTEKKSKKPVLIAKSSILLDVKPWDDETDMAKMEECVRSVQTDGLLWGASKLVPVGYGIKKLQINCVVEDDKVGTDYLEEEITKFEDYVQSVDVAAFNKI
ncbi:eukaryotic translation elongation factor 1 delta a (guanine nucleotide exchange protein) isoform X2 [Alosa alosa]|uniref:eukaryotic translation elongation factor 1 delta a (guanine nucleotide exchange protein) isoform X2 n=1 Tax=Alosa alosa TaxID=278164 RepID=UPI00201513BA|nr:eukaryotic translation elongation factor 1 delta a (guanine nucleotide exchange protein) isoform X2 [Alosa alosa]